MFHSKLKFLLPLIILSLGLTGIKALAVAQSAPTATVNQTNQDWAPGETVSVNWSTTGFGSQSVKTDISLVSTSSNRTYGLWNSGTTLGNYRSGTKNFTVSTVGTSATIAGNGVSVTVPTGFYTLRVSVANRLIKPIGNQRGYLSADKTSSPFNILPNISCLITLQKTGPGANGASLSSNVQGNLLPVGQSTSISYSAGSNLNYQANNYIIKINNVEVDRKDLNNNGGHFSTPICNQGEPIMVFVDFGPRPSCLVTASVSPYAGGQYTFSSNIVGGKLPAGLNGSVTFDPHEGYGVAETKKNGNLLNTYTPPQASNVEVPIECPAGDLSAKSASATFKLAPWEVTSSVNGSGGTITLLGKQYIEAGKDATFTVKPDFDYKIDWVKIDNVAQATPSLSHTVKYDANKKTRKIEVKFKLACLDIKPEDTLANLRAGKPAQINKATFGAWVSENKELVKREMERGQCVYISADISDASSMMRSSVRDTIYPLLSNKKPAIAVLMLYGHEVDVNGQYGEKVEGKHAVLVTNVITKIASRPSRTIYEIDFIDPEGPKQDKLRCEGDTQSRIVCDVPASYSFDGAKIDAVFLISNNYINQLNISLRNLKEVRSNPVEWIKENYTKINNYSTPSAPFGVCVGWSDFNARASQLIKECPFKSDILPETPKIRRAPVLSLESSMADKSWLERQSASVWKVVGDFKKNIFKSLQQVIN